MFKVRLLIVFAIAVMLTACGGSQALQVTDVWARPGLVDGNSAVYFVIDNSMGEEDTLLAVSSDVAQAVEMHMSMMDGDTVQMVQQQDVAISIGKTEFKPGGLHVMLIGLHNNLSPGESFFILFSFQSAGEQTLLVTVSEP